MEMKNCEYCGEEIAIPPYLQGQPGRYAKLRFCSRKCAARSRSTKVEKVCPVCNKSFLAYPSRKFCSNDCYLIDHAATPRSCPTCKKEFVSSSYSKKQIYCSRKCVPRSGKDNPNYGNRRPGMFSHSAEARRKLSLERMGAKNPNWRGGGENTGKYRLQTWVANWAAENLGANCVLCSAENAHLHHIVPRRMFLHPIMSHFRQNLTMLCSRHHGEVEKRARHALKVKKPHDIPFADRLPESILDQLVQDDLVSLLHPECDFSSLGTAAESLLRSEWFSDKGESPGAI